MKYFSYTEIKEILSDIKKLITEVKNKICFNPDHEKRINQLEMEIENLSHDFVYENRGYYKIIDGEISRDIKYCPSCLDNKISTELDETIEEVDFFPTTYTFSCRRCEYEVIIN